MGETKLRQKQQVEKDAFLLTSNVSDAYKRFFARFDEISELQIESWGSIHLLSYLCKRYEDFYKFKYSFKFNNPAPSKSYEIYQIKKLANMLTSDPQILKQYIDWIFDKKIIERKKRITSLGYFTHTELVNEFKFKFLLKKITRNTQLPEKYLKIIQSSSIQEVQKVATYGDLCFLQLQATSTSLNAQLKNEYEQLFSTMDINGFNFKLLESIK